MAVGYVLNELSVDEDLVQPDLTEQQAEGDVGSVSHGGREGRTDLLVWLRVFDGDCQRGLWHCRVIMATVLHGLCAGSERVGTDFSGHRWTSLTGWGGRGVRFVMLRGGAVVGESAQVHGIEAGKEALQRLGEHNGGLLSPEPAGEEAVDKGESVDTSYIPGQEAQQE